LSNFNELINKYLEELTFIQDKTEWFANNLSPIINKFEVVKKILAYNKDYEILNKTAKWIPIAYAGDIIDKVNSAIQGIDKLNQFILLIENNKKKCNDLQNDFIKYKSNPNINSLYNISDDISKNFLSTAEEIISNLDTIQQYLQVTISTLKMAIDTTNYASEKYTSMVQKIKFWETETKEINIDTTEIKSESSSINDESIFENLTNKVKEWENLIAIFKENFKKDRELIAQIKAAVNVHKRFIK
jgi:hypothetical protein